MEVVFKESSPVFNNCFLYFLANDKDPYSFSLGSMEYRRISVY